MRSPILLVSAMALLAGGPILAKDTKADGVKTPEAFQKLVDCRGIADNMARLACFDAQVALIAQAKASGELVVADKAEVREAKRGLFGFKMPSLDLFGGDDGEEFSEIKSQIASASRYGDGQWRFTLPDGAVWEQIDTNTLALSPKSGKPVTIKQAALGSYKASIDGQPAIKVRRVQ